VEGGKELGAGCRRGAGRRPSGDERRGGVRRALSTGWRRTLFCFCFLFILQDRQAWQAPRARSVSPCKIRGWAATPFSHFNGHGHKGSTDIRVHLHPDLNPRGRRPSSDVVASKISAPQV
jgi:hypothetical protein